MADVTVFTTVACPFCLRAKRLLERKGVAYREVDVTFDDAVREKMIAESGQRTVPQVFIGERPIGGFRELQALEAAGELDALLADG